MRIAITNAFLPSEQPSGVPYQVHHLANALIGRGHDVAVFSFSSRPQGALYELHQFSRPAVPARFLPFVMAYRLASTDFSGYDVVNCHGDNYLLWTRCPVVRTFHGSAKDELKHARTLARRLFFWITIPLESIGARMADHVVGVSEATRAALSAVQTVIPCGVDVDAFGPGEKSGAPTVLFVGTETGRKRGAWLAEQFKTHVLPAVPDAELRMVSEIAAVEPGIRRYGRVPDRELAALYRSSWLFCLPSTYEGFGVPYIEAMAAGTPVVATAPNPGAREVLGDGAYGVFVEDAQLPQALRRLLTDASFRAEMTRCGEQRARQFSWACVAASYESVFGASIAAKRRAAVTA